MVSWTGGRAFRAEIRRDLLRPYGEKLGFSDRLVTFSDG